MGGVCVGGRHCFTLTEVQVDVCGADSPGYVVLTGELAVGPIGDDRICRAELGDGRLEVDRQVDGLAIAVGEGAGDSVTARHGLEGTISGQLMEVNISMLSNVREFALSTHRHGDACRTCEVGGGCCSGSVECLGW